MHPIDLYRPVRQLANMLLMIISALSPPSESTADTLLNRLIEEVYWEYEEIISDEEEYGSGLPSAEVLLPELLNIVFDSTGVLDLYELHSLSSYSLQNTKRCFRAQHHLPLPEDACPLPGHRRLYERE